MIAINTHGLNQVTLCVGLLCEVDDLDNANAMAGNDELGGSLSLRQEVGELLCSGDIDDLDCSVAGHLRDVEPANGHVLRLLGELDVAAQGNGGLVVLLVDNQWACFDLEVVSS